jgi:hypothetical protein
MEKSINSKTIPESLVASVKSRFFAQYWGTKTLYIGGKGLVELGEGGWNLKHPDFFLQLKPLSSATREEVFDTYCKMWEFNENLIETDTKIAIDWFQNYGKPHYVKFNQEQTDFLRSKCYAIPFMEYSVDDLISFGWVQLL